MLVFLKRLLVFINRLAYDANRGVSVNVEQMVNMALSYKGISQSGLARMIGTTPQNLNQKIKRNTLTKEDLDTIAAALGGVYKATFEFSDGTVI